MRILYPDNPLDQRRPDDLYAAEFDLVRSRGFDVSIFSFEDFERGRFQMKPRSAANESILYRGWMLNPESYSRLASTVAGTGATVFVGVDAYRANHHLPGWYASVQDLTAETLIFAPDADFTAELSKTRWPGYFVKDFVKSLNTGGGSLVSSPDEISRVIAGIRKYRGEVEGGICVRRREDFVTGSERRYFVANHKAFSTNGVVPDVVMECATRIRQSFFSVDVATRIDGVLRLIEIGDGQVSDRKEWTPEQMVDVLACLRLD